MGKREKKEERGRKQEIERRSEALRGKKTKEREGVRVCLCERVKSVKFSFCIKQWRSVVSVSSQLRNKISSFCRKCFLKRRQKIKIILELKENWCNLFKSGLG